jgi:hypothetical protein
MLARPDDAARLDVSAGLMSGALKESSKENRKAMPTTQ